jgi:hypothetical protein
LAQAQEPPHRLELKPGLKCFIEDLSDTGCSVTVSGKTEPGIRLKVQFALDGIPLCMTGKLRSVNYNSQTNRSSLRIESEPLPVEMRNIILSLVFGMLPDEDEDDLPFRILDEEAALMSGHDEGSSNNENDESKGSSENEHVAQNEASDAGVASSSVETAAGPELYIEDNINSINNINNINSVDNFSGIGSIENIENIINIEKTVSQTEAPAEGKSVDVKTSLEQTLP